MRYLFQESQPHCFLRVAGDVGFFGSKGREVDIPIYDIPPASSNGEITIKVSYEMPCAITLGRRWQLHRDDGMLLLYGNLDHMITVGKGDTIDFDLSIALDGVNPAVVFER